MPRRTTPVVHTDIPDPFADSDDSPFVPPVIDRTAEVVFDTWLHQSPEGYKTADLGTLIEALSRGNFVRSKLTFENRLKTAFLAGRLSNL